MNIPNDVLNKIKSYAEEDSAYDDEDFNPMEWSGGNFDDAFSLGVDEGYRQFARELLTMIGKSHD